MVTSGQRGARATERQAKRGKDIQYFKRYYELYLMLLPMAVLFVIFRILPLYGLSTAFRDYSIFKDLSEAPWVGLKWFRNVFASTDFPRVLKNTLTIGLLEIVFCFPVPIVFALMLNELRNMRFKRVVQSISYLPHFLSWAIVGGMVIQILQPYSGLISYFFKLFNLQPKSILLESRFFYPVLIIANIWKTMGWGSIMYLAAISGIDPTLYEAAMVDGASRFQQIRHITLPSLAFIITLRLVLQVGDIMSVGFEKIFVLSNENIYNVSDVFATFNYRIGIGRQRYSFSAALGLFESVVNFILVLGANQVAKLLGQEGIF